MKKAAKLLSDFLPPHEIVYSETEEVLLEGASASVSGIALSLSEDDVIFGSALSFGEDSSIFAAYECLERFVISRDKPLLQDGTKFRISISNGVALHQSIKEAQLAASLELIERSEILSSWYTNAPAQRLNHPKGFISLENLSKLYDIKVYEFSHLNGFSVIGIFAFPRGAEVNFIAGYGAGLSVTSAYSKALKEFLARYHFLSSETDFQGVQFSPTADYHQDFYLSDKNYLLIEKWLESAENGLFGAQRQVAPLIEFQDITPGGWQEKLFVFRANSLQTFPLYFGEYPTESFNFKYRCDIPHPIF